MSSGKLTIADLQSTFDDFRDDHPGRKGLFGRRSTREFSRFRQTRYEARERAYANGSKRSVWIRR